ncbi:hypothetical protein RJ639_040398 [Escallonia herrerae]|uniref:GST C-terminal domain-containing protein n=1 Tax=Escallonia herrerae TaxID=1293975 RepID=A0AA88WGB0_9ASTE|nr:hypothetical protein RJ639_040398 [Escallonia herrerae]
MPSRYPIIALKGKEQEKVKENFSELLSVYEEGIARDFQQRSPFFNGETLGFLDIMVASNSCNYRAFSEAVGVTLDQEKHSAFFTWVHALQDCHLIKETLPPHDKLVAKIRERIPKLDSK